MLKYRSQLIVAIIMKEPIIQTWFAPKYALEISIIYRKFCACVMLNLGLESRTVSRCVKEGKVVL